jgi:hypothetical protein
MEDLKVTEILKVTADLMEDLKVTEILKVTEDLNVTENLKTTKILKVTELQEATKTDLLVIWAVIPGTNLPICIHTDMIGQGDLSSKHRIGIHQDMKM